MEGIPDEITQQHNQRVLTTYHQAEAERRAASGNPTPGAPGGNPAKKTKTEDISDIKRRLAEHKAAKLAAEQNGGSSGSAPPTGAGQPQHTVQQSTYQSGAPGFQQYQQQQQQYAAPPSTVSYSQPQSYMQPSAQQNFTPGGYGQSGSPVYGQPVAPAPYQQPPFGQHPQNAFPQASPFPLQQFSPPPFPNPNMFPAQPYQPLPPQNGNVYTGHPVGMPRPFGSGSPVPSHQQQRTHSPAQHGLPQRTGSGSLPTAPGLPQRPAVGAPAVNAFQFHQMHQGQLPAAAATTHTSPQQQFSTPPGIQANGHAVPSGAAQDAPNSASIDDLISSASKQADETAAAATATSDTLISAPDVQKLAAVAQASKDVPSDEKQGKKEKEKAKQTRLVYSDNDISPEEKMAMMPKYAFTQRKSIAI